MVTDRQKAVKAAGAARKNPRRCGCGTGDLRFQFGVMPFCFNQMIASRMKFRMNRIVATQRIGWISFAFFLQILTMQ